MERNVIKVNLSDDVSCLFEIEESFSREDVNAIEDTFDFSIVTNQVKKISQQLTDTFKKLGNSKTTVEFGVELSVESGKITSMIVKGSGKANLKITLEWDHNS